MMARCKQHVHCVQHHGSLIWTWTIGQPVLIAKCLSLQVGKLCYDSSTLRRIGRHDSAFHLPPGWKWCAQQVAVSRNSRELLYPEPHYTHSNMEFRDGAWLPKDAQGEHMSLACMHAMFH